MGLNINWIYGQMFKHWRRKRFAMFVRLVQPRSSDTLLDIGGYPATWTAHPRCVARIDTINVHEIQWNNANASNYNIRTLVGDGCALNFPDRSYDIAFSNSVIEHVGTWERQVQFASEIRRVAHSYWVQTPAYECPFEPHYLTPFVHYLPRVLQKKLMRWFTVWGWVSRPNREQISEAVDSTRLLRKKEVQLLFPDSEIITEYLLGFIPKSYVALKRRTLEQQTSKGKK